MGADVGNFSETLKVEADEMGIDIFELAIYEYKPARLGARHHLAVPPPLVPRPRSLRL